MKTPISRVVVLAAVVALLCGFDKSWKLFKDEKAKLTVMLPEDPKVTSSVEKTAAGDITIWQASVVGTDKAYFVAYNDLPEAVWKADPKKMLESARDGAAQRSKAKIVADRTLKVANKYPGREFKLVLEQMELTQRVFIAGHRLYQVNMGCTVGKCTSKEIQEYLDSLKVGK